MARENKAFHIEKSRTGGGIPDRALSIGSQRGAVKGEKDQVETRGSVAAARVNPPTIAAQAYVRRYAYAHLAFGSAA